MKTVEPIDRVFLLPWIEEEVLPSERAVAMFSEIALRVPEVAALEKTPQSPPFHAEGKFVRSHVERMVAVLLSLNTKSTILFLEEAAREKELHLEFERLLETLKSHHDFFLSYAFSHDLGKPKCVSFEGEKVHYFGHDRVGAGTEFTQAREKILSEFNVSHSHAKMLTELIRLHMEILTTFSRSAEVHRYQAFAAIASKAGLNKDLFLELAAGAIFLDACVGSLHQENGQTFHSLQPIINFYRAEREAEPEKHRLLEEGAKRAEKTAIKEIHERGGLSPQAIFELLKTPVGPVRGEVMKKVYDLLEDPDAQVDFGEHTEEIRRRANKTRELL
jgi:hypothetical protein